jgi:hypothetical protein
MDDALDILDEIIKKKGETADIARYLRERLIKTKADI